MNTQLLRRIQEKIKAEPHNFVMSQWHCGTAHCIGGWAQVLAPSKMDLPNHFATWDAGKILELSYPQELLLFYICNWPKQFYDDYAKWDFFPPSPESLAKQAEIACERIDHFILTEGRE